MHDITSILPVGVIPSARWTRKMPPHVNRRRVPGVIWLGLTGYADSNDKMRLRYVGSYESHIQCTCTCSLYTVNSASRYLINMYSRFHGVHNHQLM